MSEGMAVGNHTWDHRDLSRLTRKQQQSEVDAAAEALKKVTGESPSLLRPPYGAFDTSTKTLGYTLVNWDVDTEDWKNKSVQETTRRALEGVKPGSVILMHDIHRSTVDAVPGIILELRARGYTLVTVPQLLGKTTPGTVHYRR